MMVKVKCIFIPLFTTCTSNLADFNDKGKFCIGCIYSYNHWQARVASETLTGVKMKKIRDVCVFVYMDVRMSFCTLTLRIFVFAPRSTRITLEIELFTAVQLKLKKHMGAPLLFELVAMVN